LTSGPVKSEQQETLSASPPAAAVAAGIAESPAGTAVTPAVAGESAAEVVASFSAPLAVTTKGNGAGGGETASQSEGSGAARPQKIVAPQLLARVEPLYPEEARQSGAEGKVAVRIEIQENGLPGDIGITRSSGRASFDAAAIEAIRSWRFIPALDQESGRAVRCYITVSLAFKIKTR
jgi:TonB family C-terminal domain